MPDGLTDLERSLAWRASWNPSFAGVAIVNADFTFRSVNPQFCEIVGVSPAELLGKKFQDITPIGIREIDEKNANLVKQRVIESYLIPKSYEFINGRTVNVILLVKGVYCPKKGFLFFLSQIMLDQNKNNTLVIQDQKQINILDFIKKYNKLFIGIGTAIAGFIFTLLELIKAAK